MATKIEQMLIEYGKNAENRKLQKSRTVPIGRISSKVTMSIAIKKNHR